MWFELKPNEFEMKLVKMLFPLIAIVVGLFLFFGAYLYFNQDRVVFCPTRDLIVTPEVLGRPYENIFINVAGVEKIHAWYLPATRAAVDSNYVDEGVTKTVLFCHGNGGNISHRLETAKLIIDMGLNVLLFDYRGYGISDGSPSEGNVYADAEACYRWLTDTKGVGPTNIVVFGRSLGGAVAIELARRVECGGLIVESSFTSARDMAGSIYPFFPARFILKYKFDSEHKIADINCPVLVVHSPEDDLIPFEMGQKLYERAREPRVFVTIRGTHNDHDYLSDESYRQALMNLISGHLELER